MSRAPDLLAELFDIQPPLTRPGPWLVKARQLAEAHRPAEALMAVERALALDPRALPARSLKTSLTQAIEAAEPILTRLELAAALKFESVGAQLELAFAYAGRDRLRDAERQFRRALALDPGLAEAHGGLAALYLRAELPDRAEAQALAAVALEPANALACQTLSTLSERAGKPEAAEAWLDRAYEARALFHEPAPEPRARVLVLATRAQGNVPYRFIMPPKLYTRYVWYMEHARGDQVLPDYDLVFNTIGDPDLSGPSQAAVERFLARNQRPVINAPEPVQRTFRHLIPARLGDIDGVAAPKTVRMTGGERGAGALAERIGTEGLAYPVLLRPLASHGGTGLYRADTPAEATEIGTRLGGQDLYITQYVDYALADGQYRKGRMIFIDRRPLPYHWAISERWMVHYDSSDMPKENETDDWRRAEEERFLGDPAAFLGNAAMTAIGEIGRRLDLDYCGLDFSILPDGRVLVFEANATMLVHPEDAGSALSYRNPAVERIVEAFQALLARRAAL